MVSKIKEFILLTVGILIMVISSNFQIIFPSEE